MIPNTQIRKLVSSGTSDNTQFSISVEDSAHIMTILRSTLYTDKVMAILREYSANAWDAHRDAGLTDVPIKVVVPTNMDPVLRIRDYGKGLSREEVLCVFTQYGKSTKRGTNNAVGMLGIGSKSGFAYADTFTITSWHGGEKSIYTATLDESDLGTLALFHSEPCSFAETGVEIQISVDRNDIWTFEHKAQYLFQHFNPRPDINVVLPAPVENKEQLKNGVIRVDSREWIAVMGCVPYRIDLEQVKDVPGYDIETHGKFGGILYFNIGEADVNASREELKYSKTTKQAVVDKFNALVDEYVEHTLNLVKGLTGTTWEKRIRAQALNSMGLAPDDDMFAKWIRIKLENERPEFTIWRGSEKAHTICINNNVNIIIQDNFKRTLSGFRLGEYDYLVKPSDKGDIATIELALNEFIVGMAIDGVKVIKLSERPWTPKKVSYRSKVTNEKHKVKNFRLVNKDYYGRPYSNHWETETEREAQPDDVFIIICNFQPSIHPDFFGIYKQDCEIAKYFGKKMPEIYGYKTTAAKPLKNKDVIGIEYLEWSKAFRQEVTTDGNIAILEMREWAKARNHSYFRDKSSYSYGYYYSDDEDLTEEAIKTLKNALGENHIIVKFFEKIKEGQDSINKINNSENVFNFLSTIARERGIDVESSTKKEILNVKNEIIEKYPMIDTDTTSILRITGKYIKNWIDYIRLVDKD